MKKTLVIILAIFMAFIFSTKVIAQDGPPLEVIDNFPTQYLEYIEGGKIYQGVYMTEEEYTFYTKLKVEFNFVQTQLRAFEKYSTGLEKVVEDHKLLTTTVITDLKEVKDLVSQESWWDDNKFYIGIGFGALVTGLIIAGVQAL